MTLTVSTPVDGLADHAARTANPIGTLVKAWLAGQRSPRTVAAYRTASATHGITARVMGAA